MGARKEERKKKSSNLMGEFPILSRIGNSPSHVGGPIEIRVTFQNGFEEI